MNLLKFNSSLIFKTRRIFIPCQRYYFSEALEKFTDIFQRRAAEEQNKQYSTGF